MYLHVLMAIEQAGKSPPYGQTEGQVRLSEETLKTEADVRDSLLHTEKERQSWLGSVCQSYKKRGH